MNVCIGQSSVQGQAQAPPSKSYTHRAILCAGYSSGAAVISPLKSADTTATLDAVKAFGGSTQKQPGKFEITGFESTPKVPEDVINCKNSGTTMRLTTATAALIDGIAVLTGDSSLRSRPQGPLLDAIQQLGGRAESTRNNGQAPLVIGGPISGGEVAIPGDVSSQFITALLMAGAVTPSGLDIHLTTELKSAPYVDITLDVLDAFNVDVTVNGKSTNTSQAEGATGFSVDGEQSYNASEDGYRVPGDFSSISYLLAAGAVAGEDSVIVHGAEPSAQGDVAIVDILQSMGCDLTWNQSTGKISVSKSSLEGIEVSVGNTPDLLPTIAVLGAVGDGTTRIVDCEHVRFKETDRVAAMASELKKLGADIDEYEDVLVIHGSSSTLQGQRVKGYHDHRIIMSLAIAGLVAEGTTMISGSEHVDVSFPTFFEVLTDLGATISFEE